MGAVPALELPGGHPTPVMIALARGSWALRAAVALATEGGAEPSGVVDPDVGLVRLDGPAGPFLLAGTDLDTHGPRNDRAERARLLTALQATMGRRRFNVYFREPLPEGFDAAPVGAAVAVWLRGLDDPLTQSSRHAIYEDDGVAFEVWLTGEECRDGQAPLGLAVGPMLAEARLQLASGWVLEVLGLAREVAPELPLVVAVGRHPAMGVPQGMVRGLLYGLPTRVAAASGPDSLLQIDVTKASRTALFAQSGMAQLGAVWWMDGGDAFDLRAVAFENPWTARGGAFPGRRFARADDQGGDEARVAWIDGPARWRLMP